MSLLGMIAFPYSFHVCLVCVWNAFKNHTLLTPAPGGRMCLSLFRGPGRNGIEPYFNAAFCAACNLHFCSDWLGAEQFLALTAHTESWRALTPFSLPSLSGIREERSEVGRRSSCRLRDQCFLWGPLECNSLLLSFFSSINKVNKKGFFFFPIRTCQPWMRAVSMNFNHNVYFSALNFP